MFATERHLCIGFHGCEKSIAKSLILREKEMNPSDNDYDWLGPGFYFWENDVKRALEFAKEIKKCKDPFVIGGILNLGYCLDLTCRENAELLKYIYDNFVKDLYEKGEISPNKSSSKGITNEINLRFLDCAVLKTLNKFNHDIPTKREFDSVRAGFWEGEELYPNAGFREKNHIQLCIRNPDCILGLFVPPGYSF